MTTLNDAWQAGIDAVVADNTLNKSGFRDALKTVLTSAFTNAQGTALIDAVAVVFQGLGQINNATWANLRGHIIADPALHRALFDALAVTINQLPEAAPAISSAQLVDLREDRDQVNNAIDRLDVLIAAEPGGTVGRLVKETMRDGKSTLRRHKQALRDQIQNLTGDPDS